MKTTKRSFERRTHRAFVCETAWDLEMADKEVEFYPSLEMLDREHGASCGVVEVEIRSRRLVRAERRTKNVPVEKLNEILLHKSRKRLRELEAYVARLERAGKGRRA